MAVVAGFAAAVVCLALLATVALGLFTGAALVIPFAVAWAVGTIVASSIESRPARNAVWMLLLMSILTLTYVVALPHVIAGSRSGQGIPAREPLRRAR